MEQARGHESTVSLLLVFNAELGVDCYGHSMPIAAAEGRLKDLRQTRPARPSKYIQEQRELRPSGKEGEVEAEGTENLCASTENILTVGTTP